MTELSHRVRVFVYRLQDRVPHYLLLRSAQGIEGFWTPVHGPIGFGEQLEAAIRREVRDDTGIVRANQVIDLEMVSRWVLGDEEVIEWNYGYHTLPTDEPPRIDPSRWSDYRWAPFQEAFPSLELEFDRNAILRLHALLHDAA
ncbi:MAG TPA: NUDIX domain-containing protein [Planctomycetes bacterium]|nr:NUDIX domain-containing protein [Planctomycetota bacterium]